MNAHPMTSPSRLAMLCLGLLTLLTPLGSLSAETIQVGPMGQGLSLEQAIESAADGDVLILAPGRYPLNLTIQDRALVLRGDGGSASVILEGGGLGSVLALHGSDITLEGVTISGGQAFRGGGIYALESDLTLRDVTLKGNVAEAGGGGLYSQGGDIVIEGCRFEANKAALGGGAYVRESISLAVSRSVFYRNRSQQGAGLRVEGEGGRIDHNLFVENGRDVNGAGVLGETTLFMDVARGRGAVVEHNTFLRNGCCHIAMKRGFGVEIRDNIFTEGEGFGVLMISNREQESPGEGQPDIHHNDFFKNAMEPFTIRDTDGGTYPRNIDGSRGNLGEDPQLKEGEAGTTPNLSTIYPDPSSPVIDAGSPGPKNRDPDGTRGDIGHRPVSD